MIAGEILVIMIVIVITRHVLAVGRPFDGHLAHLQEGRYKATWKTKCRLPSREAGPLTRVAGPREVIAIAREMFVNTRHVLAVGRPFDGHLAHL